MAAAPIPQQQYAVPAPVAHDEKAQYIQQTPVWVVVVRGFQIFLSFVIIIMAGWLIHGYAMGAHGFAVVCCLFTWIIAGYTLITEKVTSAHKAYNIWAVLSLDLVMVIFWLACLGANAATRAAFRYSVTVGGCYDDGSAVSANHCTVVKRDAVAGDGALAIMSAIAGLSALQWLNFLATLIFHGHTYRLWHQEHKKPSADNATVEMKAQGTPMLAQQQQQQQYQSQMYPPHEQPAQVYQQAAPAYSPQHQPDTAYAQQTATYPPQQPQQQQQQQQYQQPAAQSAPYAEFPDSSQYHSQHQQPYSPHGTPAPSQPAYSPHSTPAPGQPYYPPQ